MKNNQLEHVLQQIAEEMVGTPDPDYDPALDPPGQGIFRRHELPIADFLLGYREALTKEYMKDFPTLEAAVKIQGRSVLKPAEEKRFYASESELIRRVINNEDSESNVDGWQTTSLVYKNKFNEKESTELNPELALKYFPVAYEIYKHFGDDCIHAAYSVMAPQTVLHRHTGPENRTGEFIRIHVPLIIPPGDVFFEVNGEEVTWDDIFGFDNQQVHSAHNYTNEYRLIFMIDIRRSRIGLPPGKPFNKNRQLYSKPFYRKPR